jgi:hypothetical protein
VGVAAKSVVEVSELESDGHLLRFKRMLEVHVEHAGACVAVGAPELGIEAASESESEAWEMFSGLVITVYSQHRKCGKESRHTLACQQWRALRNIVSGFYILQRD